LLKVKSKSVLPTLKVQYTKKEQGKQGGKKALGSWLWALVDFVGRLNNGQWTMDNDNGSKLPHSGERGSINRLPHSSHQEIYSCFSSCSWFSVKCFSGFRIDKRRRSGENWLFRILFADSGQFVVKSNKKSRKI